MAEEFMFSPSQVTLSNISELSGAQSILEEKRICELAELADMAVDASLELYRDGMGIYEILSLLSESFEISVAPHADALAENAHRLRFYISTLGLFDRTVFCELYLEKMRLRGVKIGESDFLYGTASPDTFVYVKNAYADEAYDVFSQEFADPRVRYAPSFKEALRLVSDGEVTYCLLPLEERGARLPTVAELIYRGDFKINSVTPVFGFDGNADMKYALVSKQFTVPALQKDDDRYLEIRTPLDTDMSIAQLLTVAEGYGISLHRVNSVFFDTEDGKKQYFSIVFRNEGREYSTLLIYLTLFTGAYTPVGIYKNLE